MLVLIGVCHHACLILVSLFYLCVCGVGIQTPASSMLGQAFYPHLCPHSHSVFFFPPTVCVCVFLFWDRFLIYSFRTFGDLPTSASQILASTAAVPHHTQICPMASLSCLSPPLFSICCSVLDCYPVSLISWPWSSHIVEDAEDDFELMILLPLPPKYLDYGCVPHLDPLVIVKSFLELFQWFKLLKD